MWVLATLAATGMSWAAVQAVSGFVVGREPELLSPAAIASGLQNPIGQHRDDRIAASPTPVTPSSPAPATPPTQTPVVRPAAPVVPTAPATKGNARTFTLVGGSADVSCSNGQAVLDWATPNQGYWVETGTSDGQTTIEVEFRSDAHESRLRAWCSGGHVMGTISEQSS